MLPLLLLGAGVAAVAFIATRRPSGVEPPPSTYPSGFEVHGYSEKLTMLDAPHPFQSLDAAKTYAEKLVARGFKVAIRYVPPGYVPGDTRSEAATSIHFAQPSDYNPWRAKSPRARADEQPVGGKVSGTSKFKGLTLDHIARNIVEMFKVAGSNEPQAIVNVRGGLEQMPTEYRRYVGDKAIELGAPSEGMRMALFGLL